MYFRVHGGCRILYDLPEQDCAPGASAAAASWPQPSSPGVAITHCNLSLHCGARPGAEIVQGHGGPATPQELRVNCRMACV